MKVVVSVLAALALVSAFGFAASGSSAKAESAVSARSAQLEAAIEAAK